MSTKNAAARLNYATDPLKVGTRVRVRDSDLGDAVVSEFRGYLGPRGARIYGLHLGDEPDPPYIEVREDQLEVLETPEPRS